MTTELIEEIRKMNKLLVLMVTKELLQNDKIETLSRVGFSPKEIAELIGATSNTVSVTLNKIKKRKK